MNKEFLYEMLDTMSVSGNEIMLQKKVIKEIDFELKDEDFAYMREMMMIMYSNPLINKLNAIGEE